MSVGDEGVNNRVEDLATEDDVAGLRELSMMVMLDEIVARLVVAPGHSRVLVFVM